MIIGHLPAGYLLAKSLAQRMVGSARAGAFICAALLGSVFPDIDLIYFHWIDHRQHHSEVSARETTACCPRPRSCA
jgi:inner membrane protein